MSKGGPDFVSSSGASFDVTTTKAKPAHEARPNAVAIARPGAEVGCLGGGPAPTAVQLVTSYACDIAGREEKRAARKSGFELESRYDALDRLVEQRATARPGEGEALRKTLVERAGTRRNSPIASTLLVVRPPTYGPEHAFGFGGHTGAVCCTARLECYH